MGFKKKVRQRQEQKSKAKKHLEVSIMKIKNPKTIYDHFDLKYGEKGTKSREEFEEESQANMIAELVKAWEKMQIRHSIN